MKYCGKVILETEVGPRQHSHQAFGYLKSLGLCHIRDIVLFYCRESLQKGCIFRASCGVLEQYLCKSCLWLICQNRKRPPV